jgi:hypothetical protein
VVFQHDLFQRGNPSSLSKMKRRKPLKRRAAEDDTEAPVHTAPLEATSRVSSSASSSSEAVLREALLASLGCIQQLTMAVRHAAVASEHSSSSPLATDIQVAAMTASSALRRLVEGQELNVPEAMRRGLTPPAHERGTAIRATINELDTTDRAVSGILAAVVTNQFGAAPTPASAPSSVAATSGMEWVDMLPKVSAGFSISDTARFLASLDDTYTAVEDASVVRVSEDEPPSKTPTAGHSKASGRSSVASVQSSISKVSVVEEDPTLASIYPRSGSPSSLLSPVERSDDILFEERLSPPFGP